MAPFLVKKTAGGARRAVPVRSPLLWILGVGAIVRLVLLYYFADLGLRMDEVQYQEIAVNLTEGQGFAMSGRLTSWRPPLYPFVLSVLYTLTGTTDPVVARAFQAILSLATSVVVYMLGRRLFGERIGLGAALLFTFYPSFLFYNNHILTEVLFTFLLTLTGYCFLAYLQTGRLPLLAASGVALGLAVLTRDIVWPMVAVVALLVPFQLEKTNPYRADVRRHSHEGPDRSWVKTVGTALVGYAARPRFGRWIGYSGALAFAFLVVVTPWVIRNTHLQRTFTLISTNGGLVFFAGNYEHTPLDRPWRSHALPSEVKARRQLPPELTEGEQQRVAFRKGLEFIMDHPGLTLRRAVIKAANVWGLEREVVGVLLQGGYGKPERVTVLSVTSAIIGVYILTILGGITGLCFALAKPGQAMPFHLFFVAQLLLVTVAHAAVFGHPRYHLPLIPLFSVYTAHAWTIRQEVWEGRQSWTFKVTLLLAGLLFAIWIREIFFVEFERFIQGLIRR